MTTFEPQPGERITLASLLYEVMPHPSVPTMAYGQEGRKAIIYQVKNNGQLFALKVFKQKYRQPYLWDTCQALARLTMGGLEVCARKCITQGIDASLLRQYPEMEYAVLMPWIEGATWYDILYHQTAISQDASKKLAKRTAEVIAGLEKLGYAHCDISAANIIVNTATGEVSLIDVEDMFGPGLAVYGGFPQGTDGYQHRAGRSAERGQWCAEGDRFSAAVLLAEILAWHEPTIREARDGEHYFDKDELQNPHCDRYKRMLGTLAKLSSQIADSFARAWNSQTFQECPSLAEWVELLEFPLILGWLPIQAPPPSILLQTYPREFVPILPALQPSAEDSQSSAVWPRTVDLEPPRLLKKDATILLGKYHWINWSTVAKAQEYELQSSFQNEELRTCYKGQHTSFVEKHDQVGTYCYRVRALAGMQVSRWSDIGSVEVVLALVDRPSQLTVDLPTGAGPYILHWAGVPGADYYRLEVRTVDSQFPSPDMGYHDVPNEDGVFDLDQRRVEIYGLAPGEYEYRVRAFGKSGYSPYSTPITITVAATASNGLPQTPVLKAIDNPGHRDYYQVKWFPGSMGSHYELLESESSDFSVQHQAYCGPLTAHWFHNQVPGEHYYRVISYNAQGQCSMEPSNAQSTLVLPGKPAWIKMNYAGEGDSFAIIMSWQKVAGADKYRFEVKNAIRKFGGFAASTSLVFKQLLIGVYEFGVCAVSKSDHAGEWNTARVEVYENALGRLAARST